MSGLEDNIKHKKQKERRLNCRILFSLWWLVRCGTRKSLNPPQKTPRNPEKSPRNPREIPEKAPINPRKTPRNLLRKGLRRSRLLTPLALGVRLCLFFSSLTRVSLRLVCLVDFLLLSISQFITIITSRYPLGYYNIFVTGVFLRFLIIHLAKIIAQTSMRVLVQVILNF